MKNIQNEPPCFCATRECSSEISVIPHQARRQLNVKLRDNLREGGGQVGQ